MTTRAVTSTEEGADITTSAGLTIGIGPKDTWGDFKESTGDSWTFDFSQDVELNQLLLIDVRPGEADSVTLVIGDGERTERFTPEDMQNTHEWSGIWNLKRIRFLTPISIPAGTPVTLRADGSSDPAGNVFGVRGVVITLP